MKITKKDCAEILKASFPEYTGRKFSVQCIERMWIDRIGGGGSHDEIVMLIHDGTAWVSFNPESSIMSAPCGYVDLDPRAIYAVHSYFCGTDCGITFNVHPESKYFPSYLVKAETK